MTQWGRLEQYREIHSRPQWLIESDIVCRWFAPGFRGIEHAAFERRILGLPRGLHVLYRSACLSRCRFPGKDTHPCGRCSVSWDPPSLHEVLFVLQDGVPFVVGDLGLLHKQLKFVNLSSCLVHFMPNPDHAAFDQLFVARPTVVDLRTQSLRQQLLHRIGTGGW